MSDADWKKDIAKVWNQIDGVAPASLDGGSDFFLRLVASESASTLEQLAEWISTCNTDSWWFRGQNNTNWCLWSSLDRKAACEEQTNGIEHHSYRKKAKDILAVQCSDDDLLSYISGCQHDGSPTPFLDWTKSPDIALFFAFERESDASAAIWAIDFEWIKRFQPAANARSQQRYEYNQDSSLAVRIIDPQRKNAKIRAQQGGFLCLTNWEGHFQQGLVRMICKTRPETPVIRKLSIQPGLRANDVHDWDVEETLVLIDGKARKLLAQASRNGFYFLLDRSSCECPRRGTSAESLSSRRPSSSRSTSRSNP